MKKLSILAVAALAYSLSFPVAAQENQPTQEEACMTKEGAQKAFDEASGEGVVYPLYEFGESISEKLTALLHEQNPNFPESGHFVVVWVSEHSPRALIEFFDMETGCSSPNFAETSKEAVRQWLKENGLVLPENPAP